MHELTRTPSEIVERIRSERIEARDQFGIERSRLFEALPWADAQPFMRPDHPFSEQQWEQDRLRTTHEVREMMRDYLEFAWGKANASHGTSALRSVAHFRGLLWLLGEEGATALSFLEQDDAYRYYGKPQLVRVSELVGFAWREHDNDRWVNQKGDEPLTADAALGG